MNIALFEIVDLFNKNYGVENDQIATDDVYVHGVSIDSRTVLQNDLFFAVKGDNFDGHDFVLNALEKGACAAICDFSYKEKFLEDKFLKNNKNYNNIYFVPDVLDAMQLLARYYRKMFNIPFIAITGSNGKTTTKELVNALLSTTFKTSCTQGNFNNQTGVPLTLFSLKEDSEAAIIEMGMNSLGEIQNLSKMVQPDIAIITNIGTGHIGLLGSRENIFKAKTEVLDYIKKDGLLIINADDDMLHSLLEKEDDLSNNSYSIVTVGIHSDKAQYKALNLESDENGCWRFSLNNHLFELSIPGKHNVYNALCAIAAADALKIDMQKASSALKAYTSTNMRMQIETIGSLTVINDAYNANFDSMSASLEALSLYKGRKIAILGDMLELGSFSKKYHEKIGALSKKLGIDILAAIGEYAQCYIKGAQAVNSTQADSLEDSLYYYEDMEQAFEKIPLLLKPGDIVLLKGSRGASMERLLKVFKEADL